MKLKPVLKPYHDVSGRIAIVARGKIPLVFKILNVQAAGGVGVIIIDDGACDVKSNSKTSAAPTKRKYGLASVASLSTTGSSAPVYAYDQKCVPGASKLYKKERIGVNDIKDPW